MRARQVFTTLRAMDYPKTIKRNVIAKKSVARIAIRQRIQP